MTASPTGTTAQNARGETWTRPVVLVAISPVEELDIVGPLEVFTNANVVAARGRPRAPAYQVRLVSADSDDHIKGSCGLTLLAQGRYQDISDGVDTLIVGGGEGARRIARADFADWLRHMDRRVRRIGSVCTGAFPLAAAGLLDGRRATTHWQWARELQRRHPAVKVDADPIWIQDGHVYTSAGISAGMDLALALVEEDLGSATAAEVARLLVLYLRRPGGQAQFSAALAAQGSQKKPLRDLQVWIEDNVAGDLSVEALANRVSMSPRNFARVFRREFGATPARYVTRVRLQAARRWLESSGAGLEKIASRCGFGSAEVMRRSFLRAFGVSPGAYRELFRSGSGRVPQRSAPGRFPV